MRIVVFCAGTRKPRWARNGPRYWRGIRRERGRRGRGRRNRRGAGRRRRRRNRRGVGRRRKRGRKNRK